MVAGEPPGSPAPFLQGLPGHHPSRTLRQGVEQGELGPGHCDVLLTDADAVDLGVDEELTDPADATRPVRAAAVPTQQRFDAGQELAG